MAFDDNSPGPALWRPYCQMRTALPAYKVVSASGSWLTLADGRQLIDGIASWWTASHGHRHPKIIQAIKDQAEIMPHVMLGGLTHPQAERLARRLGDQLPGDLNHVFLVDSGSVAVEVALKMATQYWLNQGIRGRTKFVCFQDAYHGDTSGAMSVCDPDDSLHSHFKGFLLEQYPHAVPRTPGEHQAFREFVAARSEQIAGIIIEPLVQAAAGLRFHSVEALQGIAQVARDLKLLLIADEIATGFGRTGRLFAVDHADIVPDIMCIGKGMTGATISLAATVARRQVFEKFWSDDPLHALMHGPTYMGNPLACAAANASLDLFENEPRLAQVQAIEAYCQQQLGPLIDRPHVVDVRVFGAFAVVQMDRELRKDDWMPFFVERGVWLRPTRDVFYLAPPFTIATAELERLCRAIVEAVDHFRTRIG